MSNQARLTLLSATVAATFTGLVAMTTPAHALQLRQGVDGAQVTATVSAGEISRIALTQDRIRMVNGDPDIDITHDEVSGDIYIKPTVAPLSKPLNLFVATEKGFTYQLLLVPENVPSEQILIRNADALEGGAEAQAWEAQTPIHASVIEVMKAAAGIVPPPAGYVRKPIQGNAERQGALSIRKTFEVIGAALQGVAVQVRNTGADTVTFTERDLFALGQAAVWLPARILGADETVTAYVVRRRLGNAQ